VVKNVYKEATNTKDGSPTPTTCLVVSGIVEHVAPVKGKSCPPHHVPVHDKPWMTSSERLRKNMMDGEYSTIFIVQNIHVYVSIQVVNRV